MFLQTVESMNKLKDRAQQRQYRRVDPSQFPIPIEKALHRLTLRTAEAICLCNNLVDD